VLNSGQQVGGSLGLALLGTLALEATRTKLSSLGAAVAKIGGAAPPPKSVPIPPTVRTAIEGAYVHGYTTAFGVGAVIMVGAFLLAAFVMPRRVGGSDVGAVVTH
jgi:hypothetical protein